MTKADPLLPKSSVAGLVPTMNNTGWMTEGLDDFSQAFVDYAAASREESLDMGCAYGVATLPALARVRTFWPVTWSPGIWRSWCSGSRPRIGRACGPSRP